MKPLFGFNKTTNEPSYAHKYITKTISKSLENEYDEIAQANYNINRKLDNKLKKYSFYIVLFGALLLVVGLYQAAIVKVPWNEYSLIVILGAISFVFGIVARIIAQFLKPKQSLLDDLEWNNQEKENWYKKRDEFFDLPKGSYEVDIIALQYQEKNGEIKINAPFNSYNNIPTIMCVKDGILFVCDNLSLYEIPMEYFSSYQIINEPKSFMNWTQKERCTKEYSQSQNNQIQKGSGSYKALSYMKVFFNFHGEEYYFEVLPYDFEKIEKLFNQNQLTIEEEKEN